MVPGIWVFKGGLRGGFFMFLLGLPRTPAKCPENTCKHVQKISRKASEIIEKSTETSAKQCISKEKFKLSLKVHKKCEKTAICQNIASGGGPPHESAIIFLRQVNTLSPLGGRFLAVVLGGTGGSKLETYF